MHYTTRARNIGAIAILLAIIAAGAIATALANNQTTPATSTAAPTTMATTPDTTVDTTATTSTPTEPATSTNATNAPDTTADTTPPPSSVTVPTTTPTQPPTQCATTWQAGLRTPTPGSQCLTPDGSLYTTPAVTCSDGTVLVTGQPDPAGPILSGPAGFFLDVISPEALPERAVQCNPEVAG